MDGGRGIRQSGGGGPGKGRRFLFLQGPHGPFFDRLRRAVEAEGATTLRLIVSGGDGAFWHGPRLSWRDGIEAWRDGAAALMAREGITDLVLYGASRPGHRAALDAARRLGIVPHCFEEGYLRPWWATYERGGTNGTSRLMRLTIADMAAALPPDGPGTPPPDRWGDLRAHVLWSAASHWATLIGSAPGWPPHRDLPLGREIALALAQALRLPLSAPRRRLRSARALARPGRVHAVLMQLAHDASFRDHGPFPDQRAFVRTVVNAFAEGARPGDRLLFRAHPLEDGRDRPARAIRDAARQAGVADRVAYLTAGRLAPLLDRAASAITVNSTSAVQALWRGLPVRALGQAVYGQPELVSDQPLAAFLADPAPPDPDAFRTWRRFLLATSQLPGGFYSARGRALLVPAAARALLDSADGYARLLPSCPNDAPMQQVGENTSRAAADGFPPGREAD